MNLLLIAAIVLALSNQASHYTKSADAIYAPLWLYRGAWQVTRKSAEKGAKPEQLMNRCALLGKYFACQQTVNGSERGLVIFIPTEKSRHYYTQTITPEGRATGRADLEISGNRWTYLSRWPQGNGKIIYYRTTKVFTGKNHIYFEQAESADGVQWTVKDSGDEIRAAAAGRHGDIELGN
ncbi:MAG: hypothetical protein ACR2JB_26880 [Bryobacteraceae bacterium]